MGYSSEDAKEIKRHAFFNEIDWDSLKSKNFEPSFKPKLNGEIDLTYFEKVFKI